MSQMILLPKKKRGPEERLRTAFAQQGYKIFTLRKWFGEGFIAIKGQEQLSAIIVRRTRPGTFELQRLEQPSTTAERTIETAMKWSRARCSLLPFPHNPTKRKKTPMWHELVRIDELRDAALAERGVLLIDTKKRVRA